MVELILRHCFGYQPRAPLESHVSPALLSKADSKPRSLEKRGEVRRLRLVGVQACFASSRYSSGHSRLHFQIVIGANEKDKEFVKCKYNVKYVSIYIGLVIEIRVHVKCT
jgi:hypothetical protein